jgi:hypothetical protein
VISKHMRSSPPLHTLTSSRRFDYHKNTISTELTPALSRIYKAFVTRVSSPIRILAGEPSMLFECDIGPRMCVQASD